MSRSDLPHKQFVAEDGGDELAVRRDVMVMRAEYDVIMINARRDDRGDLTASRDVNYVERPATDFLGVLTVARGPGAKAILHFPITGGLRGWPKEIARHDVNATIE